MSNLNQPNVGEDFIRFHRIITRGLEVGIRNTNEFLERGSIEEQKREGFLNYVEAFSSFLDGHHKVENQQLFPYFKPLIPDVPYLQLMKEHKVVDSSLKEINSGLNSLRSKRDVISSLKKLQSGFKKINQIWHPHIQIEETQLFQKVGSLDINRDEMIRIQKKFSDFFQKKAGPAYLLVPFALYNSSPEDRAILAQGFPETVTQQLVPIDWKDKWTSMQPFFLK